MENKYGISWASSKNLRELLSKNLLVLTTIFIIILIKILMSAHSINNEPSCQESVSTYLIKSKTESFELINKDIYINPEIQNILCIGKVIEITELSDNVDITIGSNPKFTTVFFTITSLGFLLIKLVSYLFNKKGFTSTPYDYLLSFTLLFLYFSSFFYGVFKIDFLVFSLIPALLINFFFDKKYGLKFTNNLNRTFDTYKKTYYTIFIFSLFWILDYSLIYSSENRNAWQVIGLMYLISNRFTKEEKLVIFSIFLFSNYLDINLCFIFTILFTTFNTSKKFHKNFKNILYIFLIPLYFLFRYEDISRHFTIDPDHFVWIFTAIKMDYLSYAPFESTLESKGVLLYIFYYLGYLFSKLINLSIWESLSMFYLFLNLLILLIFNKFNNKYFPNSSLHIYISILLIIDLTNDERIKFDARFLGSFLIFIGLYQIFIKNNDFIGGLFLSSSLFPALLINFFFDKKYGLKFTNNLNRTFDTYKKTYYTIFIFSLFWILDYSLIYSSENRNAWQVIGLMYLISNRFTKEEKLVIFSIFLFSNYLDINLCFIFTILFTTFNTSKKFHKNFKNILYIFLIPLYFLFRYEDISRHFTIDPDHFVWIFTAIKMDYLSYAPFESTLESKGVLLYIFYYLGYLFSKLINLSIWESLSMFYLFLNLLILLIFNKFNNKYFPNSSLHIYISILLIIDLTNDERIKFDARFLGSFLIFIGLYQIFIKNNDFIGGLFLSSSLFSLLTFGLPVALISSYLILIRKRWSILYGQVSFVILIFTYLSISGQLYESYIMNFWIYFGSQYPYTKIPLIDIINRNPFLFISIILLIIYIFFYRKEYLRKEIVVTGVVWWLSELFHLYLTGPRFEHYSILIVIPSYFLFTLLFSEIKDARLEIANKELFCIFSLIFSFYIFHSNFLPYHKSFPDEMYGNEIILSSSILDFNQDKIKLKYDDLNFESSTNYELGIYVNYSQKVFLEYFEKYRIIPSSSAWQIVWHRKDFINYEYFFSDEYLYGDMINDFNSEKPKYAIVNQDELTRLRNNLILNYIDENYLLIECNSLVCFYEINQ